MATTEMNCLAGGGGGETPTLLWSGSWNSGSKSIAHDSYEVLFFVSGFGAGTQKPITVLKKNASTTNSMVACGAYSSNFYRYITIGLSSGSISITNADDSSSYIYAVYGAHSLNVDMSGFPIM